MCGIVGVFHHRSGAPIDAQLVDRMRDAIAHRGPDQTGSFVEAEIGLGHRRLSIIDLSEAGRQPMTNEDGAIVVVFNGEIYNFETLRRELAAKGHVFRSRSDTEVLVHLWEERGPAMLERLVGIFAFALFDRRTRTLFLARDRFGEKPLYVADVPGGIAFASEIKALALVPGVDLSLDDDALALYVSRQFIVAPSTIHRGVRALEPATFAIYRAGEPPRVERYWTPRPRASIPRTRREREELVEHELSESVRARMLADVPVGCFLSSGIDSSLVASFMREHASGEVHTFSIGFREQGYDESAAAAETARDLGITHHAEIVEPPTFEEIERIVRQYDQPFADSSAVPTYYLSRTTRRSATVALAGDGGDEAFGGYERYRVMALAGRVPLAPMASIGERLVGAGGRSGSPQRVLGRLLIAAARPRIEGYVSLVTPPGPDPQALLVPAHRRTLDAYPIERALFAAERDATLAAQLADLQVYLPSCLSSKVDIASMACSLEVRAPFLDHALVELGLALPREERVGLREGKVTLRAISRRRRLAAARRPKRGFAVPLEVWLRGRMRGELVDYLRGPHTRLGALVDRSVTDALLDRFLAGELSLYSRVWTLLCLEVWLRAPLGKAAVA